MEEKEKIEMAADPMTLLEELKKNSVPKEEYDKAIAERNRYFQAASNNYKQEEVEIVEKPDINELRKDWLNCDESVRGLDYWKKTLALRNALIDSGQPDPFVPTGRKISPTPADFNGADKVASVVQYCIDNCGDDPDSFDRMLIQRIK